MGANRGYDAAGGDEKTRRHHGWARLEQTGLLVKWYEVGRVKKNQGSGPWWLMSIFPVRMRLRQKDCQKFQASLATW